MLKTGDLALNAAAIRHRDGAAAPTDILCRQGAEFARQAVRTWPGYAPTPLVALHDIARSIGVNVVYYKDESARFDLMNFKGLGGPYAVARHLMSVVEQKTGQTPGMEDILSGRHAEQIRNETVCCATDGNHGCSVAWAARMFGCRAVIFIHATVSDGRERAIKSFNAEVRRSSGNYDDCVREAASVARREGWTVISDTSYPGYTTIPLDVMHGYTVMAEEAFDQMPGRRPPTHLFLQTGVGAMAASVYAHARQRFGRDCPITVLADPSRAACWFRSIEAGQPVDIVGDIDTVMAGLACGKVSLLAWDILKHGANAVVAVEDADAEACMRNLAAGGSNTVPIVAGESAVAGLVALLAVSGDKSTREKLTLNAESRVLVFGTEGATDAALYEHIVGRSPTTVCAGAAS